MGRIDNFRISHISLILTFMFLLLGSATYSNTHRNYINYSVHSSYDFSNLRFDSNSEVVNFPNKTGSGTGEDPYVIRDLVIDAKGIGIPIVIMFVDVDLIFLNVTVQNGQKEGSLYNFYGVDLDQSSNIEFVDCRIINNSWGIGVDDSSNCKIHHNIFSGNLRGNDVIRSNNINISYNFYANNTCGIRFGGNSEKNYVHNNTLVNNREGISLEGGAQYTEISRNYISGCTKGIKIYDQSTKGFDDFIRLFGNIVQNNEVGVEFSNTNNNFIIGNVISSNTLGLKLENSDDNTFSDNIFTNNQKNLQISKSHGNGWIVPISPKTIVLFSLCATLALSSVVLLLLYNPKRRRRIKIKKKLEEGDILKLGGSYEEAMSCFDAILKIDPTNESATNKKIAILYELKRYNEISEILKTKNLRKGDFV